MHFAEIQPIRLPAARDDPEPLAADAGEAEQAVRELMEIGDFGHRAHLVDLGVAGPHLLPSRISTTPKP